MDQDKIDAFRAQQAQEADKQKQQVNHEEVVGSLNNLLLATMVSKDPKMVEVAQNLAALLESIGQASDQFNNSSLHLLPLANQELADSIRELTAKVEEHSTAELEPLMENLTRQVSKAANVKPVVNVPKQSVSVDTKPLVSAIDEMKQAIKDQKIDVPETDLSKVTKGLTDVKKAIQALRFPASNYVSPFRNEAGKADQVQLDSQGRLPVAASFDSSDIEIGAVEIKNSSDDTRATVTGANALKVDGSAATQPISAASLPLPTGAATSAAQSIGNTSLSSIDTKLPSSLTVTSTRLLVDNSGVTQPISASSLPLPTGASTSANQTTIIGHLDGVESLLTDIELDTDTLAVVGGGTETGALRVTIANNSTGVLSVDDNGDSLTVDNAGLTELAAAINSSKVDVNIVSSDVATGGTSAVDDAAFTAATGSGTPAMGFVTADEVNAGDVGVIGMLANRQQKVTLYDSAGAELSVGGGTQYTEDAAAAANPVGNALIVVREDGRAGSLTTADGDNVALRGNNSGELYVKHTDSIAVTNAGLTELAAAINSDKVDVNISSGNITGFATSAKQDTAQTSLDTIAGDTTSIQAAVELIDDTVFAEDVAATAADKGVAILAVRRDADTSLVGADNDYANLQVNALGQLKVEVFSGETLPVSLASVPSHAVTNAGTFATQVTGDALTSLQLLDNIVQAEDDAHQSGHYGVQTLAVRKATPANVSGADGDYEPLQVSAGRLWVSATIDAALPAGTNNIGDVDIASALPAGTNAIGKLAANSGVDIGDVDVTSEVTTALDHGSNRDIDTAAEQITATSYTAKFGVVIKADIANTGIVYIGNSDVTAGTTAATDGFPLSAGESILLKVNNSNIPYAIGSAINQVVYWTAV